MIGPERLESHRTAIEGWLRGCFDRRVPRGDLYDAMYYSLLAGGKRIRPVLLMEASVLGTGLLGRSGAGLRG